jgi:hypothetical protein
VVGRLIEADAAIRTEGEILVVAVADWNGAIALWRATGQNRTELLEPSVKNTFGMHM